MSTITDPIVDKLLHLARQAKKNSYSPYSKFAVGSALITSTGKVYSGCNVENSSYGLTICAERNAIFKMVADGEREINLIVVIGDTDEFLPPCGACRQVLVEFAKTESRVYMFNNRGECRETSVGEILPSTFFLKK